MGFLRNKKGQSLVETAIVLPMILLVVMAIIDFGLLFNNYIVISNASREAARKASLGGSDADITQQVQNLTSTLDETRLDIFIAPNEIDRFHGDEVTVNIEYQNKLITPIIGSLLGDDIPLRSQVIMRVE